MFLFYPHSSRFSSSQGYITINSTSASTPGQQVQSGGNLSLFFGNVLWDGSTVYLFISTNNTNQLSSGDYVYTPQFAITDITNTANATSYSNSYGAWTVGSNWVNGSIPQNIAIGNYYIKSSDQSISGTVGITDTYFTVNSQIYNATLNVSPSTGPGGVPIQFTGSNYPEDSQVVISYYNPNFGTWNLLTSVVANATGNIVANSQAPDLEMSLGSGDLSQQYNQISYRAAIGGIVYSYANYNEYERGLKVVGDDTANGLFGNGTDLTSSVIVISGSTITLTGEWFYPGLIYIRWDSNEVVGTVTGDQWTNAIIIGTTVASENGTFSLNVTIPNAEAGSHYISIEDSQTWITVSIFVNTATLSISPATGPGGANVQFTGSFYPPSTLVNVTYLDPMFGTWDYVASTTSDASGNIALSVQIPDLKNSVSSGEFAVDNTSAQISFRTEINGIAWSYANYNENERGIKQVANQIATGLYGNGTDLSSSVGVNVGESILVSGEWFDPGIIYVRFDGTQVVGTVTGSAWEDAQLIGSTAASQTGSFSTNVTIPAANTGAHFLAIEDSQTRLIITITVFGSPPPTSPAPSSPAPSPFTPINPTPSPTPATTPQPTPAPTPTPASTTSPTPQSTPQPTPSPTPSPLLTPTLTLSCITSTSYASFNVEITGSLTANGAALSGAPISIFTSTTSGNSWQDLTLVNTASDGTFSTQWQPSVTGTYMINATYAGDSNYSGQSTAVTLAAAPFTFQNTQDVFSVASNSTVTDLTFNSTNNELSFTVSGPSGTTGYVNAYIAKSLITDISTLKVYLDGNQITYTTTPTPDSWAIYFTYSHSTHTITMTLGVATPKPTTKTPLIIGIIIGGVGVVLPIGILLSLRRKETHKDPINKQASAPHNKIGCSAHV